MLADYKPETVPILVKGKQICTVRGLNIEDLTFLATNYLDDIQRAVAMYGGQPGRLRKNLGDFLITVGRDFPRLCAEMISLASDEPGTASVAMTLPWMTQILALKEILRLSTEEAGGLKNLIAVLAAALEIDQTKLGEMQSRLQTIIGEPEKTSPSS